jgi:hypothetical protein
MTIQVQEFSRTSNRHDQSRTSPLYITVTAIGTENKRILKAKKREKNQITCKGKPIKITTDFFHRNLRSRKAME